MQEAIGTKLRGVGVLDIIDSANSIQGRADKNRICLENAELSVTVQTSGSIGSLYDKENKRELVPNGGGLGQFVILDDDRCPVWQAWDTEMYPLEFGSGLNI